MRRNRTNRPMFVATLLLAWGALTVAPWSACPCGSGCCAKGACRESKPSPVTPSVACCSCCKSTGPVDRAADDETHCAPRTAIAPLCKCPMKAAPGEPSQPCGCQIIPDRPLAVQSPNPCGIGSIDAGVVTVEAVLSPPVGPTAPRVIRTVLHPPRASLQQLLCVWRN